MEQRIIRGQEIYETIKRKQQEVKELQEALESVKGEMGTGSAAYKVLRDAYDAATNELSALLRQRYQYIIIKADDIF